MTVQCISCHRAVDDPVPASWLDKYPELAGMCIYCVAEWQREHEDQPAKGGGN